MQMFYYDTNCKRVRFLRQILSSDAEVAFLITGSYDSFANSSYFPIHVCAYLSQLNTASAHFVSLDTCVFKIFISITKIILKTSLVYFFYCFICFLKRSEHKLNAF